MLYSKNGGEYMAKILIVEDDKRTNMAICEYLKPTGHNIVSAYDGEEALQLFHSTTMLTAIEDEYTQSQSFDELADDYVTKPFSMVLLGKRITALLRRCGQMQSIDTITFGDVTVNFSGYTAHDKNGRIDITPKEIELLKLLIEHKGLVLTRSQILDELWGYDYPIIDRTIDTYIKNLRKKLRLNCIVTVKGIGYKYEVVE